MGIVIVEFLPRKVDGDREVDAMILDQGLCVVATVVKLIVVSSNMDGEVRRIVGRSSVAAASWYCTQNLVGA